MHLAVFKFTSNRIFSSLQPFLPLHARNSMKNTGEFPSRCIPVTCEMPNSYKGRSHFQKKNESPFPKFGDFYSKEIQESVK